MDAGWPHTPEVERVLDVDLKKRKQGWNKVTRIRVIIVSLKDIMLNHIFCHTKYHQVSQQFQCFTVVIGRECSEQVIRKPFVLQSFRKRVVIFQYNIVYRR